MGATLAWAVIVVNLGASLGYALSGDIRHAVYWAAAAVVNVAVTM